MYKILKVILFASLLHGCGFHLAGEGTFKDELSNTHIQDMAASKNLLRALENNLRSNQINIVNEKSATAFLQIVSEEAEKVVLTVDSDGKAREFELVLRVTFMVKKPDNTVLLSQQMISLSRDFVFDKSDLLGANEEEQELFSEMRRDAAKLIVYRLQTI